MTTNEITTISVFENDGVRAEVFSVDGGKPNLRILDVDAGGAVVGFHVFQTVEAAEAYARRCVR